MRKFILIILMNLFMISPALATKDTILDIKQIKTDSGIEIWYVEQKSLPIISVSFGFKGAGSINEVAKTQGVARLLSNTMDEGAGKYDSQEFQKILADKSISLYFSSSRDDFTGSLKTLSKYKDTAFELLRLAINDPKFDPEPLERMKQANIARIKSSLSNPNWISSRITNDVVFEGHPYSRNSGGTISTLKDISANDLSKYHKKYLAKDRLYVSVVGNISEEEIKKQIDLIFSSLPEKSKKQDGFNKIAINKSETVFYEMDIPQSIINIRATGIDRLDPDYQAAKVMNYILGGGGFGSRLTDEVREKRGLTYGIYSSLYSLDYADMFSVSTSTRSDNAVEALEIIKEELVKIAEKPVTDKELEDAKNYLVGSLPLSLTSTDKISSLMLSLQLSDRNINYLNDREYKIKALTKEDIKRVAGRILNTENIMTMIVGKKLENIDITREVKQIPNAR